MKYFAQTFYQGTTSQAEVAQKGGRGEPVFSGVFVTAECWKMMTRAMGDSAGGRIRICAFFGYIGWTIVYNSVLVLVMIRSFQVRWRVAD